MSARWLVAAMLLAPARAHAFSDPALFQQGVDKGGSDHRYFTGSRVDGQPCSVCHEGGAPAQFLLEDLPDTLIAGQRYTFTVRWDGSNQDTPSALHLELTTKDGAHPSVMIGDPATLPAASRCEGKPEGMPAIYTFDAGNRRIVGVEDCGASAVTVSFLSTGEPIDLAIAGVRSDGSGTVTGDGTFELRTTIGAHLFATGGGGCNAGGEGMGWAACALAALAQLRAARRRRCR